MSFPFRLYLSRFLWSTWSTCSTRRYLRVPSLERPVHEDAGAYTPNPKHEFHFRMSSTLLILTWSACFIRQSFRICLPCEGLCVCVYTAIHMQKTTTGHLMTMHVMFSEFMRQRLCTLCFPNSCAKDYLTAGGCRECHSSAANEDGYDILWYRSGTLDRRTCLIMSFHFRDGMWLTQEPPCRLMIWTWFHLFIKDDGLRILPGMYNHIVIAVHFQKINSVCVRVQPAKPRWTPQPKLNHTPQIACSWGINCGTLHLKKRQAR